MSTPGDRALSLRAWAEEAEAAAGIARALAPTAFVPEQLRVYENPAERDPAKKVLNLDGTVMTVTAVLLAGQEIGLGPMASLRSFTIIRGTVAMYALAARALLQHHGHEIEVRETTSVRAIVDGRRAGTEKWQRSTWDIERAKTARLFPGPENGNWRTQTQSMLVARATAEASRWVAADALLGLPVMVEELEGYDGAAPVGEIAYISPPPEAAAEPEPTTAKRRKTPARAALPSAPPPPTPTPPAPVPPEPEPAAPKLTHGQRTAIYTKLGQIGVTERDDALPLIGAWAGRPVGSTNELTRDEAGQVLQRLEALLTIAAQDQAAEPEDHGDAQPD